MNKRHNERPGIWSCDLWGNGRRGKKGKKKKKTNGVFGRGENIFFFTNERPGIWSCDLWANERPKKKLHLKAQTDRQTDGHGDSMTESAQWADSVKSSRKKTM